MLQPPTGHCDECRSKESWPFIRGAVCLCRRCAGVLAAALIGFIKRFDRDHPRPKKPRNPKKPVRDLFSSIRCRGCEVQMPDWKDGDSPFCESCQAGPRALSGRSLGTCSGISPEAKSPDTPRAPVEPADEMYDGAGLLCR